jgi:hypothetical protein
VHGDQHIRHALSFDLAPGEVSNFIFIPVCASIGLERAAVCNDRLRRLPDIPPTPPNSLTSAYRVGGVVQHIVWVASCVGMINAARRHDGRLQTSSIASNAVPALHANWSFSSSHASLCHPRLLVFITQRFKKSS